MRGTPEQLDGLLTSKPICPNASSKTLGHVGFFVSLDARGKSTASSKLVNIYHLNEVAMMKSGR